MSKVFNYFRFLVNFALFPLKANFDDKTLSFSFISFKHGIHIFIQIAAFAMSQMSLGLPLGFDLFYKYFVDFYKNSTATDIISFGGLGFMLLIIEFCTLIFYKDLGK